MKVCFSTVYTIYRNSRLWGTPKYQNDIYFKKHSNFQKCEGDMHSFIRRLITYGKQCEQIVLGGGGDLVFLRF